MFSRIRKNLPNNLFQNFKNNPININNNNNHLFSLWVSDNKVLPELQHLSLRSMALTGHEVTLYAYNDFNNVPEGVKLADANEILDKSNIFTYKEGFNKGSYAGFADWFRAKCLYECGSTWFDCDIIAINNINSINQNETIISSQYNPDGTINPNNAFLKLKRKDKFLKEMLDYMEEVKDNINHGDTGPILLKSMIDEKFHKYSNHLSNTSFIASINYFDYMDFLKPSKDIVPLLNFDEIWGFHIWNTMFQVNGVDLEKIKSGFYFDLKEAILSSSTMEDYKENIRIIK